MENINILKVGFLGPMESFSGLEFQKLQQFASNLGITLLEEMFKSFNEMIDSLIEAKIDLALQPIANDRTGNVQIGLIQYFLDKLESIDVQMGDMLPVDHYICAKPNYEYLLQENYYHLIDKILTHKAPVGQCVEFISAVNKARKAAGKNPVEIIDQSSTAAGVANLKDEESNYVVAIGSKAAAMTNDLPFSEEPIQDLKINRTTFLLLSNKEATEKSHKDILIDQIKNNLLGLNQSINFENMTESAYEQVQSAFMVSLKIPNKMESLTDMLKKFSGFGVNLNYIKIKCDNGTSSQYIMPYISGIVPKNNHAKLLEYLNTLSTDFCLTFPIKKDEILDSVENIKVEDYNIVISQDPQTAIYTIKADIPNIPGGLDSVRLRLAELGFDLIELEVLGFPTRSSSPLIAKAVKID